MAHTSYRDMIVETLLEKYDMLDWEKSMDSMLTELVANIKGYKILISNSREGYFLQVLNGDNDLIGQTLSEKELEHFCSMNAVLTKNAWQQYARDIYPAVLANEGKYYLEHVLDGSIPEYLVNAKETYDCPVLVLTGKQDSSVGYEDQFLWLKQYPKLSYVALEGAAHNLPIDKPQVFNALAKDWFLQFV